MQSLLGAAAYMLKNILHDWSDAACLTILENLTPAMRECASRLLIFDMVILNQYQPAIKVLRDINILQFSGKERSKEQWHDLLGVAEFQINHIYGFDDDHTLSLIEAELDERSIRVPGQSRRRV